MKSIAILIILVFVSLLTNGSAMPTATDNPDVCKITLDTGTSMIGFFVWQDPETSQWEVIFGLQSYKGFKASKVFTSDEMGNINLDTNS